MTECLPEAADDVFGPVRHDLKQDPLVQDRLDHVVPETTATMEHFESHSVRRLSVTVY